MIVWLLTRSNTNQTIQPENDGWDIEILDLKGIVLCMAEPNRLHCLLAYLSQAMRKLVFKLCENKDTDQLIQLISTLVFATWIVQ